MLEILGGVSRFLADLQQEESEIRRSLILKNIDPSKRDILKSTVAGELLGSNKHYPRAKKLEGPDSSYITKVTVQLDDERAKINTSSEVPEPQATEEELPAIEEVTSEVNGTPPSLADDYPGIRDYIRKAYALKEYNQGATHGTLNSFRSAIALIFGPNLGENPEIKRFFKGVSKLKPPRPKYDCIWDPGLVLDLLKKWGPNDKVNLEKLSLKVVSLLALVTGHRMQTLSLIDVRNISVEDKAIEIKIPENIKTSKLNRNQPVLSIPFYPDNVLICPATSLNLYLKETKPLRKEENRLLISFRKPHKAVTPQTLSRWIKEVLSESGVDTAIFTAYSTRHAFTSAASRSGVTIDCILKTAGWSAKSQTFARFYKRNLIEDKNVFALSILNN
ncbi:uncharacterized protein LOC123274984 [Cotesia glomerata]|uniref:uncharacterized protein LOC123274984 n=1 Tax=Cotesia glomerata TaxID=32391 RepID=UPI001D029A4C|nr:uncharacterized protein LOC123274984 [Cotesia glomerata]